MVQTRKILYVFFAIKRKNKNIFQCIISMFPVHDERLCETIVHIGEEAGECLVEAAYLNVLLKRYHKAATYYRDAAEMYERCNLYGIDAISRTLPLHLF